MLECGSKFLLPAKIVVKHNRVMVVAVRFSEALNRLSDSYQTKRKERDSQTH